MKVLGITGGVGAGKSTVLAYLAERYQVRVIEADQVAERLQQPGGPCYAPIVRAFGEEILAPDGSLDRQRLAAAVFGRKDSLAVLNAIVHPAVKEYIKSEIAKEREQGNAPFLVLEAALLIEDHYEEICDEIWYVRTDREVRIQRLMASRGYTREKAGRIMDSQLGDAQFLEHCQFVVDNSSDFVENTYEQMDRGLIEHGFL